MRRQKVFLAGMALAILGGFEIGCKPASAPGNDGARLQRDWSKPAAGCAGIPAGLLDARPGVFEVPEGPARTDAGSSAERSAANVVAEMRGAFRVCRNQLVGRNPRAAGTVRLQLFVDCDGSVKSIHAEGNGVDDEALRCVIETARRGQFDAPAAGSAEVRVPVTFDPERPDAGSAVDAADPADAATSTDTGAAADAGDAGVGDTADAGHTEDAGAAAGANAADAGAPDDAGVLP